MSSENWRTVCEAVIRIFIKSDLHILVRSSIANRCAAEQMLGTVTRPKFTLGWVRERNCWWFVDLGIYMELASSYHEENHSRETFPLTLRKWGDNLEPGPGRRGAPCGYPAFWDVIPGSKGRAQD